MEQTAIDKALEVLFHLHGAAAPMGVSDLGRALSLPRSSAHRLLSALKRRNLVEQDAAGRYRTGYGLLQLASGILERDVLVSAARPALEAGAESLDDTFFLVAARGGRLTVLDKAEGNGELRASPRLGSTIPVHATAVGKLYLAYAASEVAEALVARERFTPHTLVDPQALAADVRTAAERGYACNRKEWIEGLSVVAAPILVQSKLLGAICTALPSMRFERLAEADLARRVIAAAGQVSRRLSGMPALETPQGATP